MQERSNEGVGRVWKAMMTRPSPGTCFWEEERVERPLRFQARWEVL